MVIRRLVRFIGVVALSSVPLLAAASPAVATDHADDDDASTASQQTATTSDGDRNDTTSQQTATLLWATQQNPCGSTTAFLILVTQQGFGGCAEGAAGAGGNGAESIASQQVVTLLWSQQQNPCGSTTAFLIFVTQQSFGGCADEAAGVSGNGAGSIASQQVMTPLWSLQQNPCGSTTAFLIFVTQQDFGTCGPDGQSLATTQTMTGPTGSPSDDEPPTAGAVRIITQSPAVVEPGESFTVITVITNQSDSPLVGTQAAQALDGPDGTTLENLGPAGGSIDGNQVSFDLGRLEPGENGQILIRVNTPELAPEGSDYTVAFTLAGTIDGESFTATRTLAGPTVSSLGDGSPMPAEGGSLPLLGGGDLPIIGDGSIPLLDGGGLPMLPMLPMIDGGDLPLIGDDGLPIVSGNGLPIVGGEGLPIEVTAQSPAAVEPGGAFTVTATIANQSDTPVVGAHLIQRIDGPEGMTFENPDPSDGSVEGNKVSFDLGELEPGESRQVSIQANVPQSAPEGSGSTFGFTFTGTSSGQPFTATATLLGPAVSSSDGEG